MLSADPLRSGTIRFPLRVRCASELLAQAALLCVCATTTMSSPDERVQCSMRIPKRFAILGVAGLTLVSLLATTLYLRSRVAAPPPPPRRQHSVTRVSGDDPNSTDHV